MDILLIECLEIIEHPEDRYSMVTFGVSSLDPTKYVSSTFNLTLEDSSHLEVGKHYDLALNEI
jgi:hypothetical protein